MEKKIKLHVRTLDGVIEREYRLPYDQRYFLLNMLPATHYIEIWSIDSENGQHYDPIPIHLLSRSLSLNDNAVTYTVAIFKIRFHNQTTKS